MENKKDKDMREFEIIVKGERENREESLINHHLLELSYSEARENREESMANSYAHEPLYARGQQEKANNLHEFDSIKRTNTLEHNTEKNDSMTYYHVNIPRESEKQETNMINLHVLEPLYEGRLEKSEEYMVNYDVLEPLYAWEPENTGDNIFYSQAVGPLYAGVKLEESTIYPYALKSSYAEQPENTEHNIFYSQAVGPLYAEGPEKREENMANSDVLEPLYAEQPENTGDNIFYSQAVGPLYAEGPERREENMVNSDVLEPLHAEQPENTGYNIFHSQAVGPLCAGVKLEESTIYPYALKSSYAEQPENTGYNIFHSQAVGPLCAGVKLEESTIYPYALKSSYAEQPENTEDNIFYSQAVGPRYAERPEKREENMVNSDVLELLYAEQPENRRNIFNPQAVELMYVGTPEKREESIVYPYIPMPLYAGVPGVIDLNIINCFVLVPVCAGRQERREESIVYSNVPIPSYLGGPVVYPNAPMSLYAGEPDVNIINCFVLVPVYAGRQENREDSIVYSNVPIPSYPGGLEKQEGSAVNHYVLEPSYRAEEPEKRGENIFNPQAVEPLYPGGPEKREESMVYSGFVPSYTMGPEKRGGNMFNSNVSIPSYPGGPEERGESAINHYVLEPSYRAEEPEKRGENIFNPQAVEPLYPGGLEKREESMVYSGFVPSYTMGPEKRGGNMFKSNVPEPTCAGGLEKREENVINPYTINPLHVGGAEEREENMIDWLPLSNDVTKLNHSIKKYYNTLHINEENHLIKKGFMDKQKDPTYKKMQEVRKKLPVWSRKNEILEAIHKNQVVIISGETGCGKSTQIPQFVLDDWIINSRIQNGDNPHINIICTQPRKIITTVLAERVAAERTEKIGDTVGYHVRLKKKLSSRTRVTFCTIGILLQKLTGDLNLTDVTHVIIDEVHERSAESDFLLMLLKDLLPKRPSLKIILMSATINAEVFSSYFEHALVLNIPGTFFSVKQIFLEDALEETGYILDVDSKYICRHKKNGKVLFKRHTDLNIKIKGTVDCIAEKSTKDKDLTMTQLINRYPNRSKQTYKNLYLMNYDKINYDLIEHILEWIITGEHNYPKKGSILIFLPGLYEIITLMEQLEGNFILSRNEIMIFPLHSSLSIEEQSRVFQKTEGVCKIVIGTNLAETSITIDDCVFVIDSGRMKKSRFNSDKNVECLETCWVTQANVVQRKGRAGRVTPGVCIHLYTSHRYEHFAARPVPEILRVSLESLLLHIALMHGGRKVDMYAIMQRMLDSPSHHQVTGTIKRLQNVDAFDSECKLTPLGHLLAKLPVDVGIGKLILCGAIFCCLDSALTIAACMSHRSPFSVSLESKERVDPKMKFFKENSDHLTILQAYREWQNITYEEGKKAGTKFAKENFLSVHTLYTLVGLKYQFLELLVSNGFVHIDLTRRQPNVDNIFIITGKELNKNNSNDKLLQGLICAALYPNIAKLKEDQTNANFDPRNTVFETQGGDIVKIHPSSVNFHAKSFSSPFLAYQRELKTSQVFILEVSMIPVLAVILFYGLPNFQNSPDGNFIISLNHNWLTFTMDAEVGNYLAFMRENLARLLTAKMRNPLLNFTKGEKNKKIIDRIVRAVTNW
ncbi:putative ATP-dependent RNA helicase DHX57 isoform X2 [Temnothorax americanus]|uniref:putative ATP-dependent RNA helicase DHX57 isoform X2 n=1 Tax=Temnothorax americanus TaxID=1964332 RepID=UPI00406842F0